MTRLEDQLKPVNYLSLVLALIMRYFISRILLEVIVYPKKKILSELTSKIIDFSFVENMSEEVIISSIIIIYNESYVMWIPTFLKISSFVHFRRKF